MAVNNPFGNLLVLPGNFRRLWIWLQGIGKHNEGISGHNGEISKYNEANIVDFECRGPAPKALIMLKNLTCTKKYRAVLGHKSRILGGRLLVII